MHRRFLLVYHHYPTAVSHCQLLTRAGRPRFGEIKWIPRKTPIISSTDRKPRVCALRRDLGLLTKPQPEMMDEVCRRPQLLDGTRIRSP